MSSIPHALLFVLVGAAHAAAGTTGTQRQSLVLLAGQSVTLDAGTYLYDRICVPDDARINVRGPVTLVLTSNRTSVIGGRGIGSLGGEKASIRIETQVAPELFVLFDNSLAPIDVVLDAPRAKASIGLTGKTGLTIGGAGAASLDTYTGYGLPAQFPHCGSDNDRDPRPAFVPSVPHAENCVGGYSSSNYVVEPPAQAAVELHVIGVYEGPVHVDGTVEVRIDAALKPVVLALSAYQATHWRIVAAPEVRIKEIYVSGIHQQSVDGLSANVPVHKVKLDAYAYGWEPAANGGGGSYETLIRGVRKETGLTETSFQGCYAGNVFHIPSAFER